MKLDYTDIYDIDSCINSYGEISERCAKKNDYNGYVVNNNIFIRTKGQLIEPSIIPFVRERNINTDFLLNPGQTFYYNDKMKKIESECVTPFRMKYEKNRIYDSNNPSQGLKPETSQLFVIGNQQCTTSLYKTYIENYNKI